MRYQEALRYLREREQFHVKVGLRNIRSLTRALGHPERRTPAVRVAGTNGKGSTVAMLDSILRAQGLRVGRFTSPHLVDIEERIVVDGVRIASDEFARLVGAAAEAAADFPPGCQPSFFETITGVALLAFQRRRVDVGIFETGMGGRWDATGVVDTRVSLVTRIALDHERFLGSTVERIAAEKGAIAAAGRPLLAARQQQEALDVLEESAVTRGARFHAVARETEADFQVGPTASTGALRTLARTYPDLALPLPGRHQLDNLALAARGAECVLEELGRPAPEPDRVRRGVAKTVWPGRLQWAPRREGEPRMLLDAAHNPDGARRLADFLLGCPRDRKRVLLFGAMRDKKIEAMLAPLLPCFDHAVLTRAQSRRALPEAELAERARNGASIPIETAAGVGPALARARQSAGPAGEVVAAGSIHLLGEVLVAIGEAPPGGRFADDDLETPRLDRPVAASP